MATIKRNGDKVILKGSKVSCSCCEAGECCMYSAQALADGLYSADDLPDEITIIACGVPGTTGTVQSFLTKSGSSYSGSPYNTTIRLITDLDGISTWLTGIENELLTTDRGCLVTILQSQAGEVVCGPTSGNIQNADNFADTYTVKFLDKEVPVNRDSLCFWSGFIIENEVFLYEADLRFNDEKASEENGLPYGWIASFTTTDISSAVLSKSGNQNTPVGVYPGEYEITVL